MQAILVTGVEVEQYSWSSGFAANLGLMLNSSEWIELRGERETRSIFKSVCEYNFPVTDSNKKTIWEDTKAHETKLVTIFIKEVGLHDKDDHLSLPSLQVGPFPGSAFGGMKDITLQGCLLSQVGVNKKPSLTGSPTQFSSIPRLSKLNRDE